MCPLPVGAETSSACQLLLVLRPPDQGTHPSDGGLVHPSGGRALQAMSGQARRLIQLPQGLLTPGGGQW